MLMCHYQRIKSVLQSNLVLALLAERSDGEVLSSAKKPSILSAVKSGLECNKGLAAMQTDLPRKDYKPLADRFEALLGALFVTKGMDVARRWILCIFEPLIAAGIAADRSCTTARTLRYLRVAYTTRSVIH